MTLLFGFTFPETKYIRLLFEVFHTVLNTSVYPDLTWILTPEGIEMNHQNDIHLVIKEQHLIDYYCLGERKISVNAKEIFKILKHFSAADKIRWSMSSEHFRDICIEKVDCPVSQRIFTRNLIVSGEVLRIPQQIGCSEEDYFALESQCITRAIKTMRNIAIEQITFHLHDNQLEILGTMPSEVSKCVLCIELNQHCPTRRFTYEESHLRLICKTANLSTYCQCWISEHGVLLMQYNVGSYGKIKFIIHPSERAAHA